LIQSGAMDRFLTTPVSRSALLGGRVLHAAALVVSQCLAVLVAAALIGAGPPKTFTGVLLLIGAAVILSAGCAAASTALAMVLRRAQTLTAVLNFCLLPIYFTSSLFMTPDLMPLWIQRLAACNPLNWAVTVARHGFEGRPMGEVSDELGLLLAFCLVCWGLSLHLFERYRAAL
ncbi:MAG: ABC transporter permease, partial [Acidobacteriota bacterium]